MRELKFRAWNKKGKRWLGVNLQMSVVDGLLWWQYGYGCEILSAEERKNIDLVQYTGLKDKNGKEIYEGDYIKREIQRGTFLVSEVIFTRGEFCVVSGGLVWSCGNSCSKDGKLGDVEIVGNIYNNPEFKEADQ